MEPETTPQISQTPAELPLSVVQRGEVGRLINELAALDESLLQLGLRRSGSPVALPKTSRLLEQTAQLNKLNLLQTADRQRLQSFLTAVREKAPVLHISFSVDPTPVFLEKLITWLRREIHPQVLLSIGLQPNLGAGCALRSTNKYFDFSLRQAFGRKSNLLKTALTPAPAVTPPAPAAPVPGGSHG